MQRLFLSHVDGEFIFSAPDGPDDAYADALHKSVGQFSTLTKTRLRFVEAYGNFEMKAGEDWREAWLAVPEDIRIRVERFAKSAFDLDVSTETNRGWNTRKVDRKSGAVDHFMMLFTTLRRVFQELIDAGIRPRQSQNPFERNLWHENTDSEKWIYCVQRYGEKALGVFPYAGAYYLAAARRPYPRSLFNPAGIGRRMAIAMRERSGDHPATNLVEIICLSDPVRPNDLRMATGADWEDCGDIIMSRNKGDGYESIKPTLLTPEVHANLCRRIDLDHAANPQSRPSVAMLREWWASGQTEKLEAFQLFQMHPSKGDGVPSYNSMWELLNKACKKHGVTVGRGAAERVASMRWARREKVDRRMLEINRAAKTADELEKGKVDLKTEMFWRTDQTGNYGSHAENQVAIERKRARALEDSARQQAEARGEMIHPRTEISPEVREADAVAMSRPRR